MRHDPSPAPRVLRHLFPALVGSLERMEDSLGASLSALIGKEVGERLRAVSQSLGPVGIDPFGWDPEYAKYAVALAALLQRYYFRTEVVGIEHLPPGRVLLVANHSGQLPLDGIVVAASVFLEANPPRVVRAMIEKWSQTLPFISTFFSRTGQVVGVPENAIRLLEREEALLVFPEGVRGLNKSIQHRYELADFGLGFMRLALQTKTPIVPVCVIGAEEQYISLGNVRPLAKLLGMPSFPLIPQMFVPGGQLPLPVKYHVYFGEPLVFQGDHDDDDAIIEEKVWVVKATLSSMINKGRKLRKHLFF